MSNKISGKKESGGSLRNGLGIVMGIFTIVVLCVFPLIYHNYYYDILETKYQFYCVAAITTMVTMAGCGLASGRIAAFFRNFNLKRVLKSMNFVDWAMIAFWLSNVISWILCVDWRWDAFWGTQGRYNGVFLITIYMIVYFLLTRFFCFKQWYLDAFLAVGILVCAFGITDYFQMDLLGFKEKMTANQKWGYTSTFGNINTYTIYVGAVLSVSMILFSLEKNWKRMLWYFGNMFLASIAIIMGTSDNAYLSMAALFGLSPLYLFRTGRGFRRYWISLASFVTAVWTVDWINVKYADKVIGIRSLFTLMAKYEHLKELVIGLWAFAAIVTVLTLLRKDGEETERKWAVYLWGALIAVVIGAVIYVLYDANVAGNAEKYAAISNYVVFNEAWGSHRGFAWISCMEMFNEIFTLREKIFGYGPETLRILMENFYLDAIRAQRVVFDNAHNEYLHYLMTIGIVGMSAYIVFLVSAVVKMAKNLKKRPEVAACMFALLAYMTQATVNLNLPIAMPITIQLLAMGLCRGEKEVPLCRQ